MRPARAWGRDQAHGPVGGIIRGGGRVPSMCLRTVRLWIFFWVANGVEREGEVGHSFTLFKCQITFVQNGTAHAPCAPCMEESRSFHCSIGCIICLINCRATPVGAVGHVSCVMANANGDTLLATCHPFPPPPPPAGNGILLRTCVHRFLR